MAKTTEGKLKTAKQLARPSKIESAAVKYVNSGLSGLGLKPNTKANLVMKLVPMVANQIKNDRSKAVTRGEIITKREAKNKVTSAKNKIMGG